MKQRVSDKCQVATILEGIHLPGKRTGHQKGSICLAKKSSGNHTWVFRWTDEFGKYRGITYATLRDCPTRDMAIRESMRQRLIDNIAASRAARKPRKKKATSSHVYLITCGDFCKIGKSNNPARRLVDLQTLVPYQCELLFSMLSNDASLIEAQMHRHLSSKRVRGEWFTLSPGGIHDAIAELHRLESTIKNETEPLKGYQRTAYARRQSRAQAQTAAVAYLEVYGK